MKIIALAYLIVGVLLIGLPHISSSSEAREGQVINSILGGGDMLVPSRYGIVPSKPPLHHWLSVVLNMMLGNEIADEFGIRILSLISATVVIIITALVARRFVSKESAVVAASALALTYGFSRMTFDGRVDMTFTAFVWIAIYFYIVKKNRLGLFLATACSILVKGPLGAVLIFLFLLPHIESRRSLYSLLIQLACGVGLAAIWYIIAAGAAGDQFVERQILFENIKRLFGGDSVNQQPFFFYIPELLSDGNIIVVLTVLLIVLLRRELPYKEILWSFCLPLCFFSIAAGKRGSYLLPLYPWLAIYLSILYSTWQGGLASYERQRILKYVKISVVAAFLFIFALVLGIENLAKISTFFSHDEYKGVGWLLEVKWQIYGVMFAICIAYFFWRNAFLPIIGVMLLCLSIGLGIKAAIKDFKNTTTRVVAEAAGKEVTILKKEREEYFDPIIFYIGAPVKYQFLERIAEGSQLNKPLLTSKANLLATGIELPDKIIAPHEDLAKAIVLVQ